MPRMISVTVSLLLHGRPSASWMAVPILGSATPITNLAPFAPLPAAAAPARAEGAAGAFASKKTRRSSLTMPSDTSLMFCSAASAEGKGEKARSLTSREKRARSPAPACTCARSAPISSAPVLSNSA